MIFLRAWCRIPVMKTIVEMIHLPLKCTHVVGLRFTGLHQSWWYPHTTNYDSGWSTPHLRQRDSHTSHNWLLWASHMPWPLPECLQESSGGRMLRWQCGLSGRQHRAHISTDFELSMEPIAAWLNLNTSTSKYIHQRADSMVYTHNWIPSWMPATQARVHPTPVKQYRLPNTQDVGVVPKKVLIELLGLVFQVSTRKRLSMATCGLHSWMVADDAINRILNLHPDDHCNCQIFWWDRHWDSCHG